MRDEIRRQASGIAEQLEQTPKDRWSSTFFDSIRQSDIPYLGAILSEPDQIYARAWDALFLLGRASVPLAVGFTMHTYMFNSLATIPLADPGTDRRRELIAETHRNRWLLGVGSFDDNVSLPQGSFSIREREGRLVAEGKKNFQSMASHADLLTVTGVLEGKGLIFGATQIRDQESVEIGAPIFSGPMGLADTRAITFKQHLLESSRILTLDPQIAQMLCNYTTRWFEALIAAPYLGGAARAIDELKKFCKQTSTPAGTSLAALDGMAIEVGRLAILLKSSIALASTFGSGLRSALALTKSGDQAGFAAALEETMECSSLIKYVCTENAELIVHGVRKLIGTRAMRPDHPIAELCGQIIFGPLHPRSGPLFERGLGAKVLGEKPFPFLFQAALG